MPTRRTDCCTRRSSPSCDRRTTTPTSASVDGVLLAAGAGRRAGGPKGLRRGPDGEPWVRRTVEVLLAGGCDRVLVVVGAAGDQVATLLDEPGWAPRDAVRAVPCADWGAGLSASLRTGLEAATADVAVVHLVDLPDVPAAVVRRVLEHGGQARSALARATYDGRPGHPVLLGADHVAPLLVTLTGDRGARAYLDRHGALAVECGDLATGVDDDLPAAPSDRLWWATAPAERPGPDSSFERLDAYVQLALRPMFQLWDAEPVTDEVRAGASPEQISLFATYLTSADVSNGGWWGWQHNSSSCLYPASVAGHRALGLDEAADLVEAAVRRTFPHGFPLDHDLRLRALERISESAGADALTADLAVLDRAYYAATRALRGDGEDLLRLMVAFVADHPARFFVG